MTMRSEIQKLCTLISIIPLKVCLFSQFNDPLVHAARLTSKDHTELYQYGFLDYDLRLV